MAVTSTGLSTKGLMREFNRIFAQAEKRTNWQAVSTIIQSTTDQETYRFLGSVPQMRGFGAGRKAKGLGVENYNVANLKYEATLEVDRDEISDDQTGQIQLRTQELALRAASHKDGLLGSLIVNGDVSGFNSYDGVSFFNASHVQGLSGAQSNIANYDISTLLPDEPDTPLVPSPNTVRAALASTLGLMDLYKDDQGEFIRSPQVNIIVAVHPTVKFIWQQALQSGMIASQSASGPMDNTSVLVASGGVPAIITVPEITSAAEFHVFDVGGTIRPFILQDREPIEFQAIAAGSEEAFRTEKYQYGVRARYRLTFGDPMKAFKRTLT